MRPASAESIEAALQVAKAVLLTIKERGALGAPAGHLYAALMSAIPEFELRHFDHLMGVLTHMGLVEKRGDVFFMKEA